MPRYKAVIAYDGAEFLGFNCKQKTVLSLYVQSKGSLIKSSIKWQRTHHRRLK